MIDIDVPDCWQQLDSKAYYNDVETFEGGLKCIYPTGEADRDDEVLIWSSDGVDKTGKHVFEGFDDEDVPDDAVYLVRVHADGVDDPPTYFASSLDEAADKATALAQELVEGRHR